MTDVAKADGAQAEAQPSVPQQLAIPPDTDAGSSATSTPGQSASGQSTPLTDPNSNNNAASSVSPIDLPAPASAGAKEEPTVKDTSAATTTKSSGTEKIYTPFEHSLPQCKPQARPPLTADQQTKYATLLGQVKSWKDLPTSSAKSSSREPLSDDERMWLTRDCILRYLRASSWSVPHALSRLQTTLVWRREFDVANVTADLVSVENETGKQVILGFDNDARPCLYLDPGRQNTEKSHRQIQHLVYMLERVIEIMEPGQETTALLINFRTATSGGSPSVSQGRQVLNILQGHYPERLGRALISDLPWYITTFFKLISPFIDPTTKSKMIFNRPLRDAYVPAPQLWDAHGGDAPFEYVHEQYWPALTRLCAERRAAYKERWVQAGKHIGEVEAYLKGGEGAQSVAEEEGKAGRVEGAPAATA